MQPHPEGGFFKECYRSPELIPRDALPARFGGSRCFSTSIYYLLPSGSVSRLHRIASDEIWHFYLGGPLELLQISSGGKIGKIILGQDVEKGQTLQHVVPAGYWFGARPAEGSLLSFVGCTVAPGFDFADFEVLDPDALSLRFPDAAADLLPFV